MKFTFLSDLSVYEIFDITVTKKAYITALMNLPRSTLWDLEFYKNMFINNLNCSLDLSSSCPLKLNPLFVHSKV